jgi:hypothetical protein
MSRACPLHLAFAALAALAALPASAARAQSYASVSYEVSFPSGSTRDFIDNESWVGFTLEGRRFVRPQLTAGFLAGYYDFYRSTTEPLQFDNGTVTGDTYRNLAAVPLLLTVDIFPTGGRRDGGVLPFIGIGAGAYWIRQHLEIGTGYSREDSWHFGIMPEVGVAIPVRAGGFTTLMARYHYPFEAGSYIGGQSFSFPYFSFGIAVGCLR